MSEFSRIGLRGMRFHSFHGYYTEEQSVGNDYEIDVIAEAIIDQEGLEDALENTLNYEQIYHICRDEMNTPVRLIETVAYQILERLKEELSSNARYTVVIRKLHPLLGGIVDHAMIEIKG